MTAREAPLPPPIPYPRYVRILDTAMVLSFISALVLFVVATVVQDPTLYRSGAFALMGGFLCYAGASIGRERNTIHGFSGATYPRFKILRFLSPASKQRVLQVDWEGGRPITTDINAPLRAYLDGWKAVCPLAVALNTLSLTPSNLILTRRLAEHHGYALPSSVYRAAVDEFLTWSDGGHIHPLDMRNIFLTPEERENG